MAASAINELVTILEQLVGKKRDHHRFRGPVLERGKTGSTDLEKRLRTTLGGVNVRDYGKVKKQWDHKISFGKWAD